MINRIVAFVVLLACLDVSTVADGYNVLTHQALTDRAVRASVIPSRLEDWGFVDLNQSIDDYTISGSIGVVEFCVPRFLTGQRPILQTIMLGAFCEDMSFGDGQPVRYLNHFYDPAHQGQGLEYPVGSGNRWDSSLAWSLNINNHTFQTFAYANFKDYLLQSVTATAERDRKKARANFLRTLGHLMHLVEDLGQPQHTREDPHGGGGGFESRVDKLIGSSSFSIADYPIVQIGQWSDIWSTSVGTPTNGIGLADFTNSQFVTLGRNFRGTGQNILSNDYQPSPSGAGAQAQSPVDAVTIPCMNDAAGNPTSGKVQFVSLPVYDRYQGAPTTIARATTFSILALDLLELPSFTGKGSFSMNDCNYDEAQAVLLPAAVGYTAGLVNYALRGRMQISLPDSGFYGLVDHSQFLGTDPAEGFSGFSKIKLKLKNITEPLSPPGAQAIPQDMSSGTLTAVLKFHRNLCYDDLLVNWPTTDAQAVGCRSPDEEIVISVPLNNQQVPFATVDSPNGPELTFDFSTRNLPINAWDVVLQVAYQGMLGGESNAVVLATTDVSEPTFVSFMNTTDYVMLNGNFYQAPNLDQSLFGQVTPACRTGTSGNYTVSQACYNLINDFTFTAGPVSIAAAGNTAVYPRHLARLALLTDFGAPATLSWQAGAITCWVFLSDPLSLQPYEAQEDPQGGFIYEFPNTVRGVNGWDGSLCYSDIGITQTDVQVVLSKTGQLDNLQNPSEITPTALTITGW